MSTLVIASDSEAIDQSRFRAVQRAWIASSLTLLAMTECEDGAQECFLNRNGEEENQSGSCGQTRHRPMPVRQGRLRDRRAGALGLARSFRREPSRAWRGLCDLCRKLAQAFPYHKRQDRDHALRGQGDKNRAQLLRELRHAHCSIERPARRTWSTFPARCSRAAPGGSRSITSRSRNCRNGPIPASRWCR